MADKVFAGINGLGRFGLHLLQYWIEHYSEAQFDINYINDDYLTLSKVGEIIQGDQYLRLKSFVSIVDQTMVIKLPNGARHKIAYTNKNQEDIPWIGQPDLFLECSGKHTKKPDWQSVLVSSTKRVIISATSWNADQILVYGFNHTNLKNDDKVLSYGSCTVNAYVPLAKLIHDNYIIEDSDVNVIHNVPIHQADSFNTLERRACTLELVAPHLLDFLNKDNFVVNYTLVPYTGVSMIDYRFRITSDTSEQAIVSTLKDAINNGSLKDLYLLSVADNGPTEHKFSPYSAILMQPSIKLAGKNLYIQAYFDNENSANRYFDVANYLTTKT